jgi:hypothetical protein
VLEKILYNDTFFKSTLTTFDKDCGVDIKCKEINQFLASSFSNIKARKQDETADADHENLTIAVDYSC